MSRVSDATGRLRLRRRTSRLRIALRVMLAVAVVLVLGAATWVVGFSEVLAVRTIAVTGTEVLDEAEVTEAAEVPVGTPLARLDIDAIEERVATLAPVLQVQVSRHWPETVRIEITERTAFYAVKQNGGQGYLLVDRTGVAYTTVGAAPQGLLVATASSEELLVDVAQVVAALPDELQEQVRTISADGRDSIELRLDGSRRVVWGSAERSDLKATVLLALLEQDGSIYDVSAPEWPAVKG